MADDDDKPTKSKAKSDADKLKEGLAAAIDLAMEAVKKYSPESTLEDVAQVIIDHLTPGQPNSDVLMGVQAMGVSPEAKPQ